MKNVFFSIASIILVLTIVIGLIFLVVNVFNDESITLVPWANPTVMCRKWNTSFAFSRFYQHSVCYKLVPIK